MAETQQPLEIDCRLCNQHLTVPVRVESTATADVLRFSVDHEYLAHHFSVHRP